MSEALDLAGIVGHEVPAGTNSLVSGPPMSGKQTTAVELLSAGSTAPVAAVPTPTG